MVIPGLLAVVAPVFIVGKKSALPQQAALEERGGRLRQRLLYPGIIPRGHFHHLLTGGGIDDGKTHTDSFPCIHRKKIASGFKSIDIPTGNADKISVDTVACYCTSLFLC